MAVNRTKVLEPEIREQVIRPELKLLKVFAQSALAWINADMVVVDDDGDVGRSLSRFLISSIVNISGTKKLTMLLNDGASVISFVY